MDDWSWDVTCANSQVASKGLRLKLRRGVIRTLLFTEKKLTIMLTVLSRVPVLNMMQLD
jgi:hypothetical protein